MRSFLRVPAGAAAGVLAALVCAGCSAGPTAPDAPKAQGTPAAAGPLTTTYSPYVSATTAAPTDAIGSPAVYNLAFVIAHGSTCRAVWDDDTAIVDQDVKDRAVALRKSGAAVRVSFGGQAGKELALTCRTPAQLAAAYATALDAAGAAEADFDIEGAALTDPAALTRRAEAIALLQKERALKVTFTLAAMPTGLTPEATALLTSARAHGVTVSAVNVMAMNYGTSFGADMGDYAVAAATAAQAQLKQVLGLSDRAAWQRLGITPMIGVNDVKGETFTLDDAAKVRTFARDKGVGRVSMWVSYRDQKCADGVDSTVAQASCSGVDQAPGAFAKALSKS
ncbi:hydrolase [Streptomyces sp. NBC_00083]|uniref:hydrolase n=1 Tax=Streptomyces sp. NBC_00083 TaxID=2975647 RepID=UPI002252D22E|nr:hydrolase [Streptomyces sp. NBC_00083]MCX5384949.1 hydrolase [Streptomyces sp. NBC_00083]